MGYINIFFVSFFCAFSMLSAGKIFNKFFINENKVSFFENIIFGCILLTFIALSINFFLVAFLTYKYGEAFGPFLEKHGAKWSVIISVFIIGLTAIVYFIFLRHG